MKKYLLLLIILMNLNFVLFSDETIIVEPNIPNDPTIINDTVSTKADQEISFQNQLGEFGKGKIVSLKGTYLTSLVWDGNESGSQKILFDKVKTIRVKGYTMDKKIKENLGLVFYFPYLYEIKLIDGTILKNAKGRIKEIEVFTVHNKKGKTKNYCYFVRYWLEDKKIFFDNKSTNYSESPKVPSKAVIYLELN